MNIKKCVCGYSYNANWITDKKNEPFKRIVGSYFIKNPDYQDLVKEIKLLACPKCGTVHIDE